MDLFARALVTFSTMSWPTTGFTTSSQAKWWPARCGASSAAEASCCCTTSTHRQRRMQLGLLEQLKEKGFHIVHVVPMTADRPKTPPRRKTGCAMPAACRGRAWWRGRDAAPRHLRHRAGRSSASAIPFGPEDGHRGVLVPSRPGDPDRSAMAGKGAAFAPQAAAPLPAPSPRAQPRGRRRNGGCGRASISLAHANGQAEREDGAARTGRLAAHPVRARGKPLSRERPATPAGKPIVRVGAAKRNSNLHGLPAVAPELVRLDSAVGVSGDCASIKRVAPDVTNRSVGARPMAGPEHASRSAGRARAAELT